VLCGRHSRHKQHGRYELGELHEALHAIKPSLKLTMKIVESVQ
jgi:hypothetical protein